MNYPLYIAKRYLFSKSNKNAVNIISRIAIIAVILGAMALFIVLSGFSGLKEFALQFTNMFDSDLKVIPAKGKTLQLTEEQFIKIQKIEGIEAVSKTIEERIFIRYEGKNHIAFIKGVDENYSKVTPIDSLLLVGDWLVPNQNEVVIGFGISAKLSIPPRDYGKLIEVYVPKPGTGQINVLDPTSAFNSERVVASGIYEINDELNGKYLFSDIDFARNLLGLDSTKVSFLEFKLNPSAQEDKVKADISGIFPEEIIIKNRFQQNDALYKMLNSENLFTYLFVSLIAAIAIFNLAGTIIMIILEKRGNIKTLYFLGLTLKEIRKVFFYNGVLMTLIGVFIGLFLGSVLVLLQIQYGFVPITESLPYPVKFKLINLLIVFLTITLLGGLASKIASLRVSQRLLS
ncbi:MAG TPA: ABC transporter permease [Flavobacteriaceae bacterium]|nr:ABC transporter permease [Flavobacteriaceae bacterium]HAT63892.1 ABC transporter permease [Flavobacteriaceae bacterium]